MSSVPFTLDGKTELPKEPEESGWYLSQEGEMLFKDADGYWRWHDLSNDISMVDGDEMTPDWSVVLRTLTPDNFPLVKVASTKETVNRIIELLEKEAERWKPVTHLDDEFWARWDELTDVIVQIKELFGEGVGDED